MTYKVEEYKECKMKDDYVTSENRMHKRKSS